MIELMESTRRRDDDSPEVDAWLDSLDGLTRERGTSVATHMLSRLIERGQRLGLPISGPLTTPYVNTIPAEQQPAYPGDRSIERRITSLIRWNAMAMVVKANKQTPGIGGHISTYASAATLLEVGFHHFFRGRDAVAPAIRCSSRATRRRAFTRAPSSKDGSARPSSTRFAVN
jgi:pyruvate dehydrogenase E1 component